MFAMTRLLIYLEDIYRFVYAFDEEIRDVIEAAISKQMATAVEQLDTYLEELPRYLPIDNTSAINVTINQDPFVSPVFLSVGIKGDFVSLVKPTNFTYPDRSLPLGLFCSDSAKMITITVCDYVINSATAVYYEVQPPLPQPLPLPTPSFLCIVTVKL